MNQILTLTIQCPDQPGIIAAVAQAISQSKGNILGLSQHTAVDIGIFMARCRFAVPQDFSEEDFRSQFGETGKVFSMDWKLYKSGNLPKVGILVSKTSHNLYELLLKHQDGELPCEFPVIVSNHPDLAGVATQFHIPFFQVDTAKGKQAYEEDVHKILNDYKVDVVVLARYMQILSKEFTDRWNYKVINIHHGFLPAFMGAKPYHQAWYKGVKLIGATAHFANENLDQGPIIAQDVVRVPDTKSIAEFIQVGKDVERKVLFEALRLYLNHAVFVVGGRTFILN